MCGHNGTCPISQFGLLRHLDEVDAFLSCQSSNQLDIVLVVAVLREDNKLSLSALKRLAHFLDPLGNSIVDPCMVKHLRGETRRYRW